MYKQNIYEVNYEKLKKQGIKCLLFDLDNTIAAPNVKKPTEEVKKLVDKLKIMGFRIVIFSNSPKGRVKPFKDELEVDASASTKKPKKTKFLKVLSLYNYTITEVAIIGDQILTDVVGGNKVGILTILTDPISKKDFILTKINRLREKIVIRKLSKKSLFIKGKYYE